MTIQKTEKILEVKGLRTSFFTDEGEVKAVDGVDFSIERGKTLGIVGESGSGKSITSLSILRLLQEPIGKIVGGEVYFKGENLLEKSKKQMMDIRGNNISMIFQEPMTSLNPTLTCGEQIAESIRIHQKLNRRDAWIKAIDMLSLVGIPSPEKRAKQYPFELSGGMRQRVMIAIALACNPELLIADEPTTALDVTIQAQILELIKKLQDELGTSLMIITHDLGVVAEMCDKVAVMYCGKVVEYADVESIFTDPKHPYTIGLLNSVPKHDEDVEGDLSVIHGQVPSPFKLPLGCRFAPRCPHAREVCHSELPELRDTPDGDKVRCWIYTDKWEKQEGVAASHE
ncbi:ABC transporter ATP-binding protein [Bacillus sp. DTU_2020_1000418_1_SI_GHA_SEK_038]|uniref:ABC transporter ATP-binding protein n=1 Tax=Bacillus sp. DTU_2020_1000418_1_SI_GHA_SEK_038 TaxID=3077585 RepID=UPI0028E44CF1|nr:ABC transporter ATP-binding protein [Bacillus sp. DTU_2020_1000418_1_SI_GHA_SEK_038]WNS76690.1 ABC transporter ATP-binding protein [Bacillus sp. DTU_2020_1000418_1_SI_GHA_SEK_038]